MMTDDQFKAAVLDNLMALRADNRDLAETVALHDKLLTGNGDPKTGLVVRMDRIEQFHATTSKWFSALIATMAAGGAVFAAIFTKGK